MNRFGEDFGMIFDAFLTLLFFAFSASTPLTLLSGQPNMAAKARNLAAEDRLANEWWNKMKKSQKDHTEEELIDSVPKHIITMAGWGATGKTSLLRAMREDMAFDPDEEPTMGGRCHQTIGPFGPEKRRVQLWDVSGKVHGEDEYMFVTGTHGRGKGPQLRPGRLVFRCQMRKQMQVL